MKTLFLILISLASTTYAQDSKIIKVGAGGIGHNDYSVQNVSLVSSENNDANQRNDILRCEANVEKNKYDSNGQLISGEGHPLTVLVSEARTLGDAIGFSYKGKDYYLAAGSDNFTATKGLSRTTVAIVQGNHTVVTVEAKGLLAKMASGSQYDAVESQKIKMPDGELLSIYCGGRTVREQFIRTANTVEALSEKAFGNIAN